MFRRLGDFVLKCKNLATNSVEPDQNVKKYRLAWFYTVGSS
jgi:hypothetical protein